MDMSRHLLEEDQMYHHLTMTGRTGSHDMVCALSIRKAALCAWSRFSSSFAVFSPHAALPHGRCQVYMRKIYYGGGCHLGLASRLLTLKLKVYLRPMVCSAASEIVFANGLD